MARNRSPRGFTLIELLTVVAIVAILGSIAVPNFLRYQLRTKSAEARIVLGAMRLSQESFRGEYDHYAPLQITPATASVGSKVPWDSTACPATCRRTTVSGCTEVSCIGYAPSGDVYFQYASAALAGAGGTEPEYSLGAAADLDADGNAGSWTYRSANQRNRTSSSLADGLSLCASASIPAGDIFDCRPQVY